MGLKRGRGGDVGLNREGMMWGLIERKLCGVQYRGSDVGLYGDGVTWDSIEKGDSLIWVGVKTQGGWVNYMKTNIKITKTIQTIYFNSIVY